MDRSEGLTCASTVLQCAMDGRTRSFPRELHEPTASDQRDGAGHLPVSIS